MYQKLFMILEILLIFLSAIRISSCMYVDFKDFGSYISKNIYVTLNTKTLSLYKIYENQMIFLEKNKINVQNPS